MSKAKSAQEAFKDRIVRYGVKPASEFLANPHNPRRHPDKQRRAVKASLETLGWIAPVIELSNGYLLDGHERVWQASALGDDTLVPYIVVDLNEDEARQALATFDYITYLAEYDKEVLADLLATIEAENDGVQEVLNKMAEAYSPPFDDVWADALNLPEGAQGDFRQITFTLHYEQLDVVKRALDMVKKQAKDPRNQNENGNALTYLARLALGE